MLSCAADNTVVGGLLFYQEITLMVLQRAKTMLLKAVASINDLMQVLSVVLTE